MKISDEEGEYHGKSLRRRIPVKLPMLPTCKCKQKCVEKVNQETRKSIHEKFWDINSRDERLSWIHANINRKEKKTL